MKVFLHHALFAGLVLTGSSVLGQMHKVAKPEQVVRAVGVYEWTGDMAKPTASRLIPVSIFIDGKLEDAGVYIARPVPFALESGNVYELQAAGIDKGWLDLAFARHMQSVNAAGDQAFDDGWFGYGKFKPATLAKTTTPKLKPSKTLPVLVSSTGATTGGGRPQLQDKSSNSSGTAGSTQGTSSTTNSTASSTNSTTSSTTASSDDPDRPTMKRRQGSSGDSSGSTTDSSSGNTTASSSGNASSGSTTSTDTSSTKSSGDSTSDDPDRPTMKRRSDSSDSGSGSSTASNGSTPADDPDRPTMKRRSDSSTNSSDNSSNTTASSTPADDPDRPTLKRKSSDSSTDTASNSADPNDPDRPTLKRHSAEDAARANVNAGGLSLNNDPNRPMLHRGKPVNALTDDDLPKLTGLPPDVHQMVAVSDAVNRDPHEFALEFDDAAARAAVLKKMQGMAQAQLAAYEKPKAAASSTAPATPKKTAASATAKSRRAAQPATPPMEMLRDEQLKAYTLSYGGAATYVYSAHTAGTGAALRYVTIVAQDNGLGELKPAIQSVTDAAHLDVTPQMRFVDVVDVEASNRASLLFELRGQNSRQFGLYRVIAAHSEQIFLTGTTE